MEDRRLAAIMFTDIVGYTALMGSDEKKAFEVLRRNRNIQKPIIKKYKGKWLKEMGDGILASFDSASDAVRCAGEILYQAGKGGIELRIGIHSGEVVFEDNDVFGSGVNLASRIESIAPGGVIWASESIHKNVNNKSGIESSYVREESLKNVKEPVRIYQLKVDPKVYSEDAEDEENQEINSSYQFQHGSHPTVNATSSSTSIGNFLTGWRRTAVSAVILIMIAVIGYIVLQKLRTPDTTPEGKIMLAVLPFDNLTGNQEQEYFCDGLTWEMITQLGGLKPGRLAVIAPTSSMRYKGSLKSIEQIGHELGVQYILEGSVRKSAGRIRITAQLIQVHDLTQLWVKDYEGDFSNILSLQNEVAQHIAQTLEVELIPAKQVSQAAHGTANLDAYDKYIKARSILYNWTPDAIEIALEYFHQALKKDPNYALAYVGISHAWAARHWLGYTRPAKAAPKWKEAALKAVELDSTLSEAHESLAWVKFYVEWDWLDGLKEFHRAIELNPSCTDWRFGYYTCLIALKRFDKAITGINNCLEEDPFNPSLHGYLRLALLASGKIDDYFAHVEKLPNVVPEAPRLAIAFSLKNKYEDALNEWEKYYGGSSSRWNLDKQEMIETFELGYAQGGYQTAMKMAAERLAVQANDTYVQATEIAQLYAEAGAKKKAIDWLERAFQEGDSKLSLIDIYPVWGTLRDHPRFQYLIGRMNFPESGVLSQIIE